jgi:hypothetical protein
MTTRTPRPDPRVVGGTYSSGYWNEQYQVLAVEPDHCYTGATCWTVRWADGRTTHHSTAWDWRRDRVIDAPRHDCSSLGGSHSADCQLALSRNSWTFLPGDENR